MISVTKIEAINLGKHYQSSWLFRNISFQLTNNQSIAILGKNGAGKSTLLQIIYGLVMQNEGFVKINSKEEFKASDVFSFASPYQLLPDDFSVSELYNYQKSINKVALSWHEFKDLLAIQNQYLNNPIKTFSSGMLQRLKNTLAFCSPNPILILDEPLSNLDAAGEVWYKNCLDKYRKDKLLILAGNNPKEIELAETTINLNIK